MRSLQRPVYDAADVFNLCISNMNNNTRKARLASVAPEIGKMTAAYILAGQSLEFFRIETHSDVGGRVSGQEMSDTYTQRMARKNSPGRSIYDELLMAPSHGTCPFCSARKVYTLDHYLPKSHFPAFAVSPVNLVPACMECNHRKGGRFPTTQLDQILHPYFDNIEGCNWLHATVNESQPASLSYFVRAPSNCGGTIAERIEYHFNFFGLKTLYAVLAAEELVNIQHRVAALFESAGSAGVRDHLLGNYESYSQVNPNSWQAVMYRTLADNEWYCNGGFR